MMDQRPPDRRPVEDGGFVLVSALLFVVLLIVLTSAGVYLTRQETRTGIANMQFDRAYRLAERGTADMVTNWRNYNVHTMTEWSAVTDTDTLPYGHWTATMIKTSPLTYFINSTAQVTMGNNVAGATRQVGMMARLMVPTLDVKAALTTQDSVVTRGSAQVVGGDVPPTEWATAGMCTGASNKPGILIDDPASVNQEGSSVVAGTPPTEGDATIADSTFTTFGDDTFAELVSMANKTLPGGVYNGLKPSLTGGGECDVADNSNWGEPEDRSHACADYFPIVYLSGSSELKGSGGAGNHSRGQGILLVNGDLLLEGRFAYYGIIITSGNFKTASNGNKVVGGVYSGNLSGGHVDIAGSSQVQYSSCVVQWALERSSSARMRPFGERNWIDVSTMLW